MKTLKIIMILASVFCLNTAFAQEGEIDNRERIQFGLKAGLNFSNIFDSKTEDFTTDPKFGFAGGAFVAIPIGKYLGLQPEILISQKGFKGEGRFLGSEYKFTRTTTYLDIPIQIAFKPSEFFTLVAGPQYSYLLKQKDKFDNTYVINSNEEEFKNENIRKNILGVVAGIDFNVKHVIIGARIGWDVSNNNGDGTSNTPRYRNTWLQGTIGYTFP